MTKDKAIDVLKQCIDPELGIDVWTLGLIYELKIGKKIDIKMTFTTPLCPYGPMLLNEIKTKFQHAGVNDVDIDVVFNPPWKPSEEVKEMLGVA